MRVDEGSGDTKREVQVRETDREERGDLSDVVRPSIRREEWMRMMERVEKERPGERKETKELKGFY